MKKYIGWFITAVLVFGYVCSLFVVKPRTVEVEKIVVEQQRILPSDVVKPEDIQLCQVYDDYDLGSCIPYIGEVMVEGKLYYKLDHGNEAGYNLEPASQYRRKFYIKEVTP